MRYLLVLQIPGDSLSDYDAMVALEDQLIGELGGIADVDGHDVGAGATNIFLLTSDPVAAFQRSRPVIERAGLLTTLVAAYRPIDGEDFTVVWPARHPHEFRAL